jgi:hypothetical protein
MISKTIGFRGTQHFQTHPDFCGSFFKALGTDFMFATCQKIMVNPQLSVRTTGTQVSKRCPAVQSVKPQWYLVYYGIDLIFGQGFEML